MHSHRDKEKLVVVYGGQFIQIYATEWSKIYDGCSSQYDAYTFQISCDLDGRFSKICTFKVFDIKISQSIAQGTMNWLMFNWQFIKWSYS